MKIFSSILRTFKVSRRESCKLTNRRYFYQSYPGVGTRSLTTSSGNNQNGSVSGPGNNSSTPIIPVAYLNAQNADGPLKILVIPISLFNGDNVKNTVNTMYALRNHAQQLDAFAENAEVLSSNKLSEMPKLTDDHKESTQSQNYLWEDEAKIFEDEYYDGMMDETHSSAYGNQSIPYNIPPSTRHILSDVPEKLQKSLGDAAISSMTLAFEMDMTNLKDALIDASLPNMEMDRSNSMKAANFMSDSVGAPETIPLNFNALIHGTVNIDSSKMTPERLEDIEIPQFNDYITTIAANICSTALQKGFPADINRYYSTKSTEGSGQSRNPHVVCVKSGDKGCVSPGNADLAPYVSKGNKGTTSTSNTSKTGEKKCSENSEQAAATLLTSTIIGDLGARGLMSCKAYSRAIEEATRRREAAKKDAESKECASKKDDSCPEDKKPAKKEESKCDPSLPCGAPKQDSMCKNKYLPNPSPRKSLGTPCTPQPNPCNKRADSQIQQTSPIMEEGSTDFYMNQIQEMTFGIEESAHDISRKQINQQTTPVIEASSLESEIQQTTPAMDESSPDLSMTAMVNEVLAAPDDPPCKKTPFKCPSAGRKKDEKKQQQDDADPCRNMYPAKCPPPPKEKGNCKFPIYDPCKEQNKCEQEPKKEEAKKPPCKPDPCKKADGVKQLITDIISYTPLDRKTTLDTISTFSHGRSGNGRKINMNCGLNQQPTKPSCSAVDMKAASGKCGDEKKADSGKCGDEKKAGGASKCGDEKKAESPKCGADKKAEASKCGGEKKAEAPKCEGDKKAEASKCGGEKKAEASKCGGEKKAEASKCGGDKKAEASKNGADKKAEASKCRADKKAEASKNGADKKAEASKCGADKKAEASKNGADKKAETSKCGADKKAEASKNGADKKAEASKKGADKKCEPQKFGALTNDPEKCQKDKSSGGPPKKEAKEAESAKSAEASNGENCSGDAHEQLVKQAMMMAGIFDRNSRSTVSNEIKLNTKDLSAGPSIQKDNISVKKDPDVVFPPKYEFLERRRAPRKCEPEDLTANKTPETEKKASNDILKCPENPISPMRPTTNPKSPRNGRFFSTLVSKSSYALSSIQSSIVQNFRLFSADKDSKQCPAAPPMPKNRIDQGRDTKDCFAQDKQDDPCHRAPPKDPKKTACHKQPEPKKCWEKDDENKFWLYRSALLLPFPRDKFQCTQKRYISQSCIQMQRGKEKNNELALTPWKQVPPQKNEIINDVIRIGSAGEVLHDQEIIDCLSDYDVLVRTSAIAISGSDIHVYETGSAKCLGVNLGHDAAGIVEKAGKCVDRLKKGDRIVMEPGIPCGICEVCKSGSYNMCQQLIYNSFFSTYQTHPADMCHKIPDNLTMEDAALTSTLASGCQACSQIHITPMTTVLIIGACAKSCAAALCARALGAKSVAILSSNANTLETIRTLFDLNYIQYYDGDLKSYGKITDRVYSVLRDRPNFIINYSISESSMKLAVNLLQPSGVCVMAACDQEQANINTMDMIMRNISLVPSFRSANMFPIALNLMKSAKAPIGGLVSGIYTWDEVKWAFHRAQHESNIGNRKIVVQCPGKP